MTSQQDVTGEPRWQLAREIVAQVREMPAATIEAEIEVRLYNVLGYLFPNLKYPDLATQYQSGNGPIDVYCRNVVFETKQQGKKDDARMKADGSGETPEEQAVRYLNALTVQTTLFDDSAVGWRAGITDGKEWSFYDYNSDRDLPSEQRLALRRNFRLETPADDDDLLAYLYDFVNRTVKMAPPTDNIEWANQQVQPFLELVARYENSPEYDVKRSLWRGVLRGAFLNPQGDAAAEHDLFARHTMLVVIARAGAETLRPPEQQSMNREQLHDTLTAGFAAWLLDAAGADGANALDNLVAEVNNYEWRAPNRDTLKDLYHAVIAREIRHDFGEYYTPDWLARAVCEEVMDADWRRDTIEMAVAGQLNGPAVLDPSCGSGTFLYHATQLLLEDARQHPELAGSPQGQVEIVSELIAGMDLHPVAVELSKTTKMLAFGNLAKHYAIFADSENIYLGDSLQWETRRNRGTMEFGEMVDILADESDNPLRLPSSLLLSERFPQLLTQIFDYANRTATPETEANLLAVLNLPNASDRAAIVTVYRRFREYIASGRDNVWQWYIANLIQPLRLANLPVSRMVGNPPWVVYNAMSNDRQDTFRQHASDRKLWAGRHLATQNDLAATFVATCIDYYLTTGGKFGFVLPYAALRARHWEPFRTGNWSLPQDAGRQRTLADLSTSAWDFFDVNAPPFPQANSSVVYGSKIDAASSTTPSRPIPLADILEATNSEPVNTKMSWPEVKPRLRWNKRKQWPVAPSPAYANAFRNGATLFPQSLVVFEQPKSRSRGLVYFRTNSAKGAWKGTERDGQVEERFVKPALFSRLLLPFGTTGNSHLIAPFDSDSGSVLQDFPPGNNVQRFNLYWSSANADYQQIKSPKSPDTLAKRIDLFGNLSAQLTTGNPVKVIYNSSGSHLSAVVIESRFIASHTFYWLSSSDPLSSHYLAAILNAGSLAEFFRVGCRASDRHFMLLPVQNLPIPAYDSDNEHHANLAAQSQLAHRRVATLVAERQSAKRRINRNDVLRDTVMQTILGAIDESVRAIFPEYCT